MRDPEPGSIIGGYELVDEIARGGMGTIYRARHVSLGSQVAVKVLKRDLASRPDTVKRFIREGKLIARLDHPGIIKVFDVGRQGDFYYIIMELVEGRNLQQVVDQDGPLPIRKALDIARQVALALHHAHRNGVIHRDVKPSNLILSKDGTVYVTDFGIARLLDQDTALTRAGSLIGTPSHMSPEQCRGSGVDERSDIYSLGATLYTLVSGRPPFKSKSTARLVIQLLHDNPPPIETLVERLEPEVARCIKRMMAKHPAARYQTANEVADAIDVLNGEVGVRRSDIGRTEFVLGERPAPARGWMLASVCAVAIAISLIFVWMNGDEGEASTGPPAPENGENPDGSGNVEVTRRSTGRRGARGLPRKSRRELRRELEHRIAGLQRALITGETRDIFEFVDPEIRRHPDVLISLGKVVQSVGSLGPDPLLEHTLSMDDSRADVFFTFEGRESAYTVQVPSTWRLREDGVWYVRPPPE